jgi:predicted PurR-regulated permease PerM
MRSVVAFYRTRPLVGAIVFVIGLAMAIATAALQTGGGVILPIALAAFLGILVGSVVAVGQRNKRAAEDRELERALDAADTEPRA